MLLIDVHHLPFDFAPADNAPKPPVTLPRGHLLIDLSHQLMDRDFIFKFLFAPSFALHLNAYPNPLEIFNQNPFCALANCSIPSVKAVLFRMYSRVFVCASPCFFDLFHLVNCFTSSFYLFVHRLLRPGFLLNCRWYFCTALVMNGCKLFLDILSVNFSIGFCEIQLPSVLHFWSPAVDCVVHLTDYIAQRPNLFFIYCYSI